MRIPILATALLLLSSPAFAEDFYVDPEKGSADGDGSANAPWQSIQDVIDRGLIQTQNWDALPHDDASTLVERNPEGVIRAGDTIWLRTGFHGSLEIVGHYNAAPITIAAEPGHTPRLSRVLIRASAHWNLEGLHISPEFGSSNENQTIVRIDAHGHRGPAHNIRVQGCRVFSAEDASEWSASDWNRLAVHGISASGREHEIIENTFRNVDHAISIESSDSLIEANVVDGFSGDGIRGRGDRSVFQYNTVKNCYDVDDNHDDGFQSWSVGPGGVGTGEVTGIVLRGNRIINYEDPEQPMRCTLQGIGLFDGTFVDWVVENNVIITDHWHGITFLGARNVRIVNNTVVDPNDNDPGPPWIRVAAHKNGTPSEDCAVRNNLAPTFNSDSEGVIEDHNLTIVDPAAIFADPRANDLHLLPEAAAVDTGSADLAPDVDADRISRPIGNGVDIGAYEWHDGSANPMREPDDTADGGKDRADSCAESCQGNDPDTAIERHAGQPEAGDAAPTPV